MTAAERRDMDSDRNDPPALAEALRLLRMGLWPIPNHALGEVIEGEDGPKVSKGKEPIGASWGKQKHTEATLRALWAGKPDAAVGLKVGIDAGVIDFDVDDPAQAEPILDILFDGERPETMGWSSRRGWHLLFRWDDRLAAYSKTIINFTGVAIRIGSSKPGGQFQSVVPPSPNEDGTPRIWNEHRTIAELPDSVFAYLDRCLKEQPSESEPQTIPLFTPRPGQWSAIERARAYLAKVPPAISGERGHDQTIKTACNVGPGFNLSEADTLLVLREWSATCQPPWSEKELRHKVTDAYKREKRRGWLLNTDRDNRNFGGSDGSGGKPQQEQDQRDKPWRRPRLDESSPAVAFPLEALPASLADLCRQGALALQCPVDYLAAAALALAGAAIGMSVNLRLKPGFTVPPHLYLSIVGPPGTRKSPAVNLMARPFYDLDRDLHERYQAEKATHDEELKAYENAKRRGDAGAPPVAPIRGQLTLDDVTREALAQIHGENPRGLVIIRDELFGWVAALNAYKAGGKGDDRQFWLSVNSGMPIKVNRKGGDRTPIVVSRPCVALVGGLTPAMLPGVRGGSTHDDGWLDRILFSYPDPVEEGGWSEDAIPEDLLSDWVAAIRRLWSRKMYVDPDTGRLLPYLVGFRDDSARAQWKQWYDAHQAEKRTRDFPSSLRGPWSKLEGFAGRLTLILSQLRHAYDAGKWPLPRHDDFDDAPGVAPQQAPLPTPVDTLSVWGATRLAEYFKSHFRRSARELSPRGWSIPDDCLALVKWLRFSGRDSFSERDAKKNFEGRFGRDPVAFSDAADWLIRHDCIRELQPREKKRGRPHSASYRVNPYLLDPDYDDLDESPEDQEFVTVRDEPRKPQNPQNSDGGSKDSESRETKESSGQDSGVFGGSADHPQQKRSAEDWLREWLSSALGGPHADRQIALESGYSPEEIDAAVDSLGIVVRRRQGKEWWGLPGAVYWDYYQDWED